jgi:hypothetical protein
MRVLNIFARWLAPQQAGFIDRHQCDGEPPLDTL